MSCRGLRDRLTRTPAGQVAARDREHVRGCPPCAAFAQRLEAARSALREHRAAVEPDAGFAARVAARAMEPPPAEVALGWAALRVLPVAVALLVALALADAAAPGPAPKAPSEDVVAWLLTAGEAAP